jgi:hypothetical protein
MKTISEGQQVSSKVQDMKKSVATGGPSDREHQIVWWHTGLSGATLPDCLVHQRTVATGLSSVPPDYPVQG